MRCDMKCCRKDCEVMCPLVIIGPGVTDRMNKKHAEERRAEWVEDMESHVKDLLESLKRDHPELFEKVVKHKPRYNIVEESIEQV